MNMKIASLKFFDAILFFTIVIAPLRAQTNAPAENGTNPPVAVAGSAPASNFIAATRSDRGNTGVPVGGQNAAGIKLPGLEIHGSGKTDVEDIVAIVGVYGMSVAVVAITFYTIHRRNKLVHDNLRAMIEKGMPITPELVETLKGKYSGAFNQPLFAGSHSPARSSRSRGLLPGLILTGIGAALMIDKHGFSGGGLIVFFIGIAFLIVWLVERMDRNNGQPPKQ